MSRPCKGITPRLVALVSGALRPRAAERLRRHLEACPSCNEAYERLSRAQEYCRALGQEEPPVLPWRQIEAQVHWKMALQEREVARRSDERRRSLRPLALAGALTVGLTAGLVLAFFFRPPASPVERQECRSAVAPKSVAPRSAPAALLTPVELVALPTMVRGDVRVELGSGMPRAAIPLEINRPLLEGSRLSTRQGEATLQWAQGRALTVAEHSAIELARFTESEQRVALAQGQVYFSVASLSSGQRLAVVAGGRVRAAVRGTRFSVSLAEETVRVRVQDGVVHVDSLDQRWPGVDVPAGYAVSVALDARDAPKPVPLGSSRHPLAPLNLVSWTSLHRVLATTGLLEVLSTPEGADLRLDAQPIGRTNLVLRGNLGSHLIEQWRGEVLLDRRWVEVGANPRRLVLDERRAIGRPAAARLPAPYGQLIEQRAVQIRACYERYLKRDPKLEGKLTLDIHIGEDGAVSEVSILGDTFAEPLIGKCAQHVVQRWQFPSGKAMQLVYPLIFRPQ